MNMLIIALLLATGAVFTVSIQSNGNNTEKLRKVIETQYFNMMEILTQDYFEKCQRKCMEYFKIGFADGKNGSIPKVPTLPQMKDDQRVNAFCLLAQDFYKKGFSAGSSIKGGEK